MRQAKNILVEAQDLWYILVSFLFNSMKTDSAGLDRVVGIATRYGLDGPEIKSLWGRDFPHPSSPVDDG
jgi:hypothetical protein